MEEFNFVDYSKQAEKKKEFGQKKRHTVKKPGNGMEKSLKLDMAEPVMKKGERRRGHAPSRSQRAELERKREQIRRRKKRRRKRMLVKISLILFLVFLILLLCFLLYHMIVSISGGGTADVFHQERRRLIRENDTNKPEITEDFLTVNPYSRPGEELGKVKNIFVHYTANPGTSAAQNKSYFENLGLTGETSASAHFIIGYDGEIIQCIPLDEIGYAVKERNYDSISIECCYLDEDGKFTEATYRSLLKLCGWLLREYKLASEDMMRHYDAGGKKCPLYYVEHEDAWEQFLEDLKQYISA